MDNPQGSFQQPIPQPQQVYQSPPPLLNMVDWLLNLPSIPLSMKSQFFMLWELPVFANLEKMDIERLLLKFKEWCILMKWYIPDRQWCNRLSFSEDEDSTQVLDMDLNMLFNTLYQAYYMQLTRGRDGFTVKEMTSIRQIIKGESEKQEKKKFSLF